MLKSKFSWQIVVALLIVFSVGIYYWQQPSIVNPLPNVAATNATLARTFHDYRTGKGTLAENPIYVNDEAGVGIATIRYKMVMPNAEYATGQIPILRSDNLKKGSNVKIEGFQNMNSLDFDYVKIARPASPSQE